MPEVQACCRVAEGQAVCASTVDLTCCWLQLVAKAFPHQAAIDRVIELANTFWREHPDQHIAIHCAYGALLHAHTCCQTACRQQALRVRLHADGC